MSALPIWWDKSLPDIVARREPMPGVERLQTSYARYKKGEASVRSCWELPQSRKNCEQGQGHYLPDDHLVLSGLAPETVSLRIVEAPAEFGIPVKQDRRLMPAFRVRAEVKYRSRLSFPLTMKAYVINQQEKDNILAWSPEEADLDKSVKKPVTDLKGTTCITHHFEANKEGNGSGNTNLLSDVMANMFPNIPAASSGANLMDLPRLQNLAKTVPPVVLLNMWNNENDEKLVEHMLMQQKLPGSAGLFTSQPNSTMMELDGAIRTQGQNQQAQRQQLVSPPALHFPFNPAQFPLNQSQFSSLTFQQQQNSQLLQQAQQMQMLQQAQQRSQQHPMLPAQGSMLTSSGSSGESEAMVQDYEFTNLEFLKPTRMNKVYMVFACTIMDMDTLFVVYNVPTIGICRAEQREKACQKLGVPMSINLDFTGGGMKQEQVNGNGGVIRKNQAQTNHNDNLMAGIHLANAAARKRNGRAEESSESNESSQLMRQSEFPLQHTPASSKENADMTMATPCSKLALQEFINEQYESTGLLHSSSNHASISVAQWDEFSAQYRTILRLLRHIAAVWNLEEPFVVCGFDMDRIGTVHALSKEPAGTFVCRFSMSQPGCLVLSCKTIPNHPKADMDDLIHAIIKVRDFKERRVDTWIRDFAGATHVLDVYRSKRVDKRKVFASNYLRLKGMDQEAPAQNSASGDVES
eukprot:gene31814-7016_t